MSARWLSSMVLGLLSLFTPFFGARAQWSTDSTVNNVICASPDTQATPFVVTDGSKGAIIVWDDKRTGLNYDIYAQRITSAGTVPWTTNGVAICTAVKNQRGAFATPDGAGGMIVTWFDFRTDTADIYAQRINSNGVVQWTTNGVVICNAVDDQRLPRIVKSGTGNAIIAWQDKRNGVDYDIYAQRVNGAGTVLWTANGIPICTAVGDQDTVRMISDGVGGAIIVWLDHRNGSDYDIYAQRVDSTGTIKWAANGVPICTATGDQVFPRVVTDTAQGAIIVWQDFRNGTDYDIYAQHVDSSGTVKWTTNGVPISVFAGNQDSPIMQSDGEGGAIIAWADHRNGADYDIYAQRINSAGSVRWAANGIPIAMAPNDQTSPRIGTDGAGGAFVAWEDWRSGTNSHIYAQRVDSAGVVRWAINGIPVTKAANDQLSANVEGDGASGVTIVWQDYRNGTDFNIYAQHIGANGSLGGVTGVEPTAGIPESFVLNQNYPNPFNPSTNITYQVPTSSRVTLKVFDILGREVRTLVDGTQAPAEYSVRFDGSNIASGVYFYQLQAGSFMATRKLMLLK